MQLQTAERKNVKIKLALQGSAGSGKSYSALLLSRGLVNDWSQIAVIDTENRSASLYAHLGEFNILNLDPPFSPERYIEAIETCKQANVQVIVIDSLSMEWEFILNAHAHLTGNSYTNWSKFTPRHQQLIQHILHTDCHIICTLRSKQDYVLTEKNGKQVPEKVGMKPIQREGVDYEFTIVFELDIKHNAVASKDRTGLFMDKPEPKISTQTGKQILDWCNEGVVASAMNVPTPTYDVPSLILECQSVEELRELYYSVTADEQLRYRNAFNLKKEELNKPIVNPIIHQNPIHSNGHPHASSW